MPTPATQPRHSRVRGFLFHPHVICCAAIFVRFQTKADKFGFWASDGLSAYDGGLNGSTQHFIFNGKDGVCGDQSKISSRLHCGRENGVVGALAAGESLKAIGRAFGKPSSSIYCQVAPHGGDSSCTTASLAVGIDARGA